MMQKSYLKNLESISKKFAEENDVYDIIFYGSAVKGKDEPNDLDVLLIFIERKLKERLEIAQRFKTIIRNMGNFHIESINIKELFDASFFARQGIITEGYSLIHRKNFAEILGFEGKWLFNYNLKNLNHTEKTRFTYALIGRAGAEGIIKKSNAEILGKGAFLIPIKNSFIFEEFLKSWKLNYKKKLILESQL